MKMRKAVAIILICCMVSGQAVWAAEPPESTQEKNVEMEDSVDLSMETKDNLENKENLADIGEESIPEVSENAEDTAYTEITEDVKRSDKQELQLYTNYDRLIKIPCGDIGTSEVDYEIQIDDESVCKAEISEKITGNLVISVHTLKVGKTQITIFRSGGQEGDFSVSYIVNAQELPEDAVPFEDTQLREKILSDNSYIDENMDGYISFSEFENVTLLSCEFGKIKSLKGLEYAPHLKYLHLGYNLELTEIDVLFQLKELEVLSIRGTGISDENRWKLADFKDFEMNKGDIISLPKYDVFSDSFGENLNFSVNIMENEELVELSGGGTTNYSLRALKRGKVRLKLIYKETYSTEITVTINGVDSAQEVGEIYTEPVQLTSEGYNSAVMKSNGEVWEIYPEVKLTARNIKEYFVGFIYANGMRMIPVKYGLDRENVLWNGKEKIATDVMKFDGHYVMDSKGIFKDIYNKDTEPLENVKNCVVCRNYNESDGESIPYFMTYVLKNDGTLWSREEVLAEEKSNSFTKIADGMSEIYSSGCLSADGNFYWYRDLKNPVSTGIKQVAEHIYNGYMPSGLDSYYGMDDYLYVRVYIENGEYKVYRVGRINAKRILMTEFGCLILSEEGELFEYMFDKELVKLESDIKSIRYGYSNNDTSNEGQCICQKEDGSYHYYEVGKEGAQKAYFSEENPGIINENQIASTDPMYSMCKFQLIYTASENDCIVKKENAEILDHVVQIWGNYDQEFALRTDGTVWNITGIPEMVLDLATNTYVPGDVNEDGAVNIEDLRIVLRGVCEKLDLTERQIQIADVEKDGKMDIQDLRKILRFVCGKIDEL